MSEAIEFGISMTLLRGAKDEARQAEHLGYDYLLTGEHVMFHTPVGNTLVSLADGRKLSVPIAWYPRLANASPKQRRNWEIIGPGVGFHWPDVDEDLSVEGMLRGVPAPGVRPQVPQGAV